MVILLIAWLSTHILILPSIFGTNRAEVAHELNDSLINPLRINSSTCLSISIVSWDSFYRQVYFEVWLLGLDPFDVGYLV